MGFKESHINLWEACSKRKSEPNEWTGCFNMAHRATESFLSLAQMGHPLLKLNDIPAPNVQEKLGKI